MCRILDGRDNGFLRYVLSKPLVYEPGKGPFVYSDMNYYILSRVVEQVTGMTTAAFLQQRLFNPLHFRGNAWGPARRDTHSAVRGYFCVPVILRPTDICWPAAAFITVSGSFPKAG